jgi:DHA3 family tetracycline resistance protein-like MFS transporter
MSQRSLPSQARLIYLIMRGVATFANTLVLTILALYYLTDVGMNPLQLVLAGTVFECAILLCEIPTGIIADAYSRRLSVIIGTFILGAALLLEGLLPLVVAVLAAEVIAGVGETFLSGATDAWLADEVGEQHVGQVYLRSAQVNRVVGLVAIPASVALASIRLNLPVVLGGALYLALGLFLVARMSEHGFRPVPRAERASWSAVGRTWRAGLRVVRASPLLLALLGVNLVAGAAGEGFDRLWEAHLLRDITLPALGAFKPVVWFGVINAATMLASLLVAALFERRLEAISRSANASAWTLVATTALVVASGLAFGLAGSFAVAAAALLVKAVVSSVSEPLYRAWLVRQTSPQTRATLLSLASQANSLGETAGGPFIGVIGTLFSLRAALTTSALLLAPALALYARTLGWGNVAEGKEARSSAD